jgi:MoxR-like ATPase
MNAVTLLQSAPQVALDHFSSRVNELIRRVESVVFGQREPIVDILTCILADGHALLEGVPGLGKTLMVRTFADLMALRFTRIQFTPDLMPADIIGTSVLFDDNSSGSRQRRLEFQEGPIFTNLLLADEINRATPKTQSALLEAMAERQVTTASRSRPLAAPFFVLATQNPLEQEGTYPLPEAQLDRFMFKILVDYPSEDALVEILGQKSGRKIEASAPVIDADELIQMQDWLRELPVAPTLVRYLARILRATHPDDEAAPPSVKKYVRYGASPRGAQSLLFGARVRCAMAGRGTPSSQDLADIAKQALRHRILLNFEGQAQGISTDSLVEDVLANVSRLSTP